MKINNIEKKSNIIKKIIAITMAFAMVIVVLPNKSYGENITPEISGSGAYVLAASTGEAVYEKNPEQHLNPGGIVKLMSAMVLIDNIKTDVEYDNKLEIDENLDFEEGGLIEGEIISVSDLIKLMLIDSSNEASQALAKYSMESLEEFVSSMNAKAKELNLQNTNFTNPTGISDEMQYSSAEDVAMMTGKALDYPLIKKILSMSECTIRATNKSDERIIKTKVALLNSGELVEVNGSDRISMYEGVYAGKTGKGQNDNTSSLTVGCINDDMDLIVVILGDNENNIVSDSIKLLDYSINNVTRNALIKYGDVVGEIKVRHGEITKLNVMAKNKGYVYLPKGASEELIETVTVIDKNLTAPVTKGEVVGRYNIYIGNELVGGVDLMVNEDVKVGWFPSYLYISNRASIIVGIVTLVILIGISYIFNLRRINLKKKRERRAAKIKEMAIKSMEMEEDRKRRNWTYHK